MDPVVAAFGTALVGAIATDAWQQVREAVTSLWRRVYPQRKDDIGAELDELRQQVLVARHDGDADTERALARAWQVRLQQLLRADPALAAELQRVLDQVLTPALTPAEQTQVGTIIMSGSSHDSSMFTQTGTQARTAPTALSILPSGQTLQLQYPRSLPEEVVQGTVIPAVEEYVRGLASVPAAIQRAVVTTYMENMLRIVYLASDARVLHEDVIPILATVRVHQTARDQLDVMRLDTDLLDAARKALDDKRMRRRGEYPAGRGVFPSQRRYLRGQCPDSVPVGKPFSLLVSIVRVAAAGHAELEPFDVPPEGRDVLLVVHAPGLRLLSGQRPIVHVPAEGDSRPVMFELRAETPGPRRVSVTAWLGGSYLGELLVEITAERDRPPGPDRDVLAEMATESTVGAVSLVVRYDPVQRAYRFEFRDEDNPDEVTSNLAYDPGPLVEQLLADLDELARGRSGYSAAQTRDYLVNAGARLWSQLVPAQLREQFWDRQHRIRQLTILADKDAVPWELLYPMDPGHDAGFLIEQFPVTRAIFRWLPSRTLNLRPARFVLPGSSPPEAQDEIDAMRRLLDPGQPPSMVISSLTPLQDLIADGNFGLLHFACHNAYNPGAGSFIALDNVRFTPMLMTTAAINKVLARSAPTIFINACRSAGLAATYNQLDGWATKFLEAGAAAFIGSLWAVSDGAAREFAQELYGQLQAGCPLGTAVMRARQAAAAQPDDPTWLAYTVYGNPRATITGRTP